MHRHAYLPIQGFVDAPCISKYTYVYLLTSYMKIKTLAWSQIEKNEIKDYVSTLNKSELKDFINKNWWFLKMSVNLFDAKKQDNAPKEYEDKIPNWAIYFEAVVSDGTLNMNWYKIDIKSRTQEAIDFYMNEMNGLVYYQHNMDKPIGKTLYIGVEWDKLVSKWYVYDDTHTNKEIERNLTVDISTWHITLDYMYEDEDGVRYDKKVVEDKLWEAETWDGYVAILEHYTLVVTELLFIEYSFVSVWANLSWKVTKKNSLYNFYWIDKNNMNEEKLKFELEKERKNNEAKTIIEDVEAPAIEQETQEGSESDEQTENIEQTVQNESIEQVENIESNEAKKESDDVVQPEQETQEEIKQEGQKTFADEKSENSIEIIESNKKEIDDMKEIVKELFKTNTMLIENNKELLKQNNELAVIVKKAREIRHNTLIMFEKEENKPMSDIEKQLRDIQAGNY